MLALLRTFSWQELRRHPWRGAAAIAAVMLGVALALAVHLINASALSEFSGAVRSVNGQPDLELRATRAASTRRCSRAWPPTRRWRWPARCWNCDQCLRQRRRRVPLRVVGLDPLVAASLAPALIPQPARDADRMALFAPATVFLNPAARDALAGDRCGCRRACNCARCAVAGSVTAAGGAAGGDGHRRRAGPVRARRRALAHRRQAAPGADRDAWVRSLALPAGVVGRRTRRCDPAREQPLARLPREPHRAGAGGAVHRRLPGVLGAVAQRRAALAATRAAGRAGAGRAPAPRLVLAESAALGVVGSAAGVALGTLLAHLALRMLGGDLGGGYFEGVAPRLHWSTTAAVGYGVLGVVAAMVGGWFPARSAERLPLAQSLKGLRASSAGGGPRWIGWRCWRWPACWRCCRRSPACRWRRTCRWACCWWAASPRCRRRSPRSTTGSRRRWRTACCRCWPWSARAACARRRPWRSAAWWRPSAWRWR
jgi:putative ABC transport system permease protein